MATKKSPKRVILKPEFEPDSFTREELKRAIKKVGDARRAREKQKSKSAATK